MAENSSNTLKEWDFNSDHVQQSVAGEKYIGAHSVLVAAGPPKLSDIKTGRGNDDLTEVNASQGNSQNKDVVYPIGVIQNLRMNQNRQVRRLFEIGSERAYLIPGRLVGRLQMGRVLYHGKSLLRALQAYRTEGDLSAVEVAGSDTSQGQKDLVTGAEPLEEVAELPGSDNQFWINLASEFFDHPIGVMFYLKDNNNNDYGHFYVEDAIINTHSMQLGAGSTIITENATMEFDRAKPVELTHTGEGPGQ